MYASVYAQSLVHEAGPLLLTEQKKKTDKTPSRMLNNYARVLISDGSLGGVTYSVFCLSI